MPIDDYFEGKGEEVMASMKTTYANKGGKKKAKSVFYALANKMKKKPKAHMQAKALAGALLLALVAPLLFAQHILQRPGDVLVRPGDMQLSVASWPQQPSGAPTPAPSTLLTDLVSAWPLSADGIDAHGANDLTNNNGVTFVPLGPSGVVASFISANQEYLSAAAFPLDLAATGGSVEGWLRLNPTPGSYPTVFSFVNGGSTYLKLIRFASFLRVSSATATNGSAAYALGDSDAARYVHFAVTVAAGGVGAAIKLYIDGVDTGNADLVVDTTPDSSTLHLGAYAAPADPAGDFSGEQAFFRVWGRVLSGSDVAGLFVAGKGEPYAALSTADKVSLISAYDLDEVSGNRADSHGSNTLTDNNTVGSTTNSYPANMPGTVANFVAASSQSLIYSPSSPDVIPSTGSWSEAIWFNSGGIDFGGIVGDSPSVNNGHQLFSRNNNTVDFYIGGGGGEKVLNVAATANAWHLAILTYTTGTNVVAISVDGGSPVTDTLAGSYTPITADSLRFGDAPRGAFYTGLTSSPLVYSRVLTPTERACLWNAGAGGFFPWTGLCN